MFNRIRATIAKGLLGDRLARRQFYSQYQPEHGHNAMWPTGRLRALFIAVLTSIFTLGIASTPPAQAKYAAVVIDAKTGQVLHAANADTRHYPASITKVMTLFLMFDALKAGT